MFKMVKMFLVMALFSGAAHAVDGIEREVLLQFVETMNVAERGIRESQRESSETSSDPVEYQKILSDINEISLAIHRHVVEPSKMPREVKALYLSYKLSPNELEKEKLLEVVQVLELACGLAIEAAKVSTDGDRTGVLYERLLWDVKEVIGGLSNVLNKMSRKPRMVNDLYLEYQQ